MPTTVYFATNRALTGPPEQLQSYSTSIATPSDPSAVTYGTAFVDTSNLTADTVGAIAAIQDIQQGRFSQHAVSDLSDSGRNLLVFVHGFGNSFENAITRAAFNREWFAASGVVAADTTVVAFSWPSLGKLISLPFSDAAYRQDQTTAGQSGLHLMSFFSNLEPIITSARAQGRRVFLLAHSMGNWALQAAVESWFMHGNGDAFLFDEALLVAADEVYNTFDFLPSGRLSALDRLARRISTYASEKDAVLKLSMAVNLGAKRLGQDGPRDRLDTVRFPPEKYRMVDCSGFRDFAIDLASSHQYYRRSPGVRTDIAHTMGSEGIGANPDDRRSSGSIPRADDQEVSVVEDLTEFVTRHVGRRSHGTLDLIDSGPGAQRLFKEVGNEGLTRALLATNFWRSWLASDSAPSTLASLGARPGALERSRVIIVSVDEYAQFDLVVLDPTLPREFSPKASPHRAPLEGLMAGAERAFRRDSISKIGAAASQLAVEVGGGDPSRFSILLAREPEFERLSAPVSPLMIDNLTAGTQSTAGVLVEDLVQSGRLGVTAALHAIDRATAINVDGQKGVVVRTDPVTDSAFIEVALGHSVTTQKINGVMSGIAPRGNQSAKFAGHASQACKTVITGWDPQVPNPSSRRQACIYTRRDAQPGDSGSALVTDDDWIVGFAFERTKPGESPAECSWIWAESVLNRLNVKLT
jgi:esterase/lipase superfamily enzyme